MFLVAVIAVRASWTLGAHRSSGIGCGAVAATFRIPHDASRGTTTVDDFIPRG
jgi:hypothetical protein